MKQVNPKFYDKKYFEFQSSSPNFFKKLTSNKFNKKYQEISNLIKLKPTDKICDFGCGNGDLSFLLFLKYDCSITGIDYSHDAINICQTKLKLFKKNTNNKPKIKFYNLDNQHLPKLKNIKAVYFCDVFEHLYPQEIKLIVNQVSSWGNPDIVVHTDNDIYLKIIQPIIDATTIITGKSTLKEVKQQKKFHQKRHVNLTNPKKLSQTMETFGYSQQILAYPKIDKETVINQLGSLSKIKLLVKLSLFIVKLLPFLIPSFYSVYSSKNHKKI